MHHCSIIRSIAERSADGQRFYILFPMHRHEKRTLDEEWGNLRSQGFFRIVYLASPDELSAIYDDLVAYAARFVRNA